VRRDRRRRASPPVHRDGTPRRRRALCAAPTPWKGYLKWFGIRFPSRGARQMIKRSPKREDFWGRKNTQRIAHLVTMASTPVLLGGVAWTPASARAVPPSRPSAGGDRGGGGVHKGIHHGQTGRKGRTTRCLPSASLRPRRLPFGVRGGRRVAVTPPRATAADAAAGGASALDLLVSSGILLAIGQAGDRACER